VEPQTRRRRPRWLPTLAALVGVVLTAAAGNWQLDRAHQKEARQAAYDRGATEPPVSVPAQPVEASALLLRRVEARGEYVPQAMVLLDNKVHGGVPGYHVVMPLRIAGSGMHVLVNRGWIAAGRDRGQLPEVSTPQSTVTVSGAAVVPGRFLELGKTDESGPVWQNLTIERFVRHKGLAAQPVVIEQRGGPDDGLVRDWPRPDFGIDKHYGYAVQWFVFCGLIIVLYVYFHARNARSKKNPTHAPAAGRD
jgi:surfeit locus 1 family protein